MAKAPPGVAEKVREKKSDLEDLADTDLPIAPVAERLLDLLDENTVARHGGD